MDTPKRRTLQTLAGLGALAALPSAWAQVRAVELRNTPVSREYDLSVAETPLNITGKPAQGITINGTMPGPVLRFREGDEVVIRVTNNLREVTGIHWHGLLVPNDQDGVPGVTYPGIRPARPSPTASSCASLAPIGITATPRCKRLQATSRRSLSSQRVPTRFSMTATTSS